MDTAGKKILLVEDEQSIAQSLSKYLQSEGFQVSVAETIKQSSTIKEWDLCLLDWMLPDGQGIDLLRNWRQSGIEKPVIFLTAKSEVIDKVLGLELGADDYITKPFEPRELLARIHVRLRAAIQKDPKDSPSETPLVAGDLRISQTSHEASYQGSTLTLTKMEFDLLLFFAKNVGKVYSRDEILDTVWGYDSSPTTRTVDTHVLQLRQKTDAHLFETIRGVGYRMISAKK